MRRTRIARIVGFAALLVAASLPLATAAQADRLVTREGDEIETKGPWKVKGKQVIFTLPNGSLSSLRLSEVDLDASAIATTRARTGPPAKAEAKPAPRPTRPPVMVLTDKDVRRARPAAAPTAATPPAPSAGEAGATPPSPDGEATGGEAPGEAPSGVDPEVSGGVEVQTWETVESNQVDGLELMGVLSNPTERLVIDLSVRVRVNDTQGQVLHDTQAFLRQPSLGPGRTTTFRVLLPDVDRLDVEPVFAIQGTSVAPQIGGR